MTSDTLRMPRFLSVLIAVAATGLAINFMQGIGSMLTSIFLAVNMLIVVYPLQGWLRRRRLPNWIGAVISLLLVFAILIVFVWSLGWSVSVLVQELPKYSDQMNSLYQDGIQWLSRFGVSETQIQNQVKSIDPSNILTVVQTVYSSATGVMSLLAVVVTVSFFLAMDSVGMPHRMDIAEKFHPRLVAALEAFASGVRRYWIVSSVFGLIMAVLDVIALQMLGVPMPIVWGVLAFLTNYIPNIGFVIGLVPPALMGTLDGGVRTGVLVVVAYCVLNFVIQSLIQPKFAGDAVGVTPTLSFVSLLFWAWALGAVGALLALPLTLLFKAVLVDADPDSRWVNALIAADPTTAEASSTARAVDPDNAGGDLDRPHRDSPAIPEADHERNPDKATGERPETASTDGDGPVSPAGKRGATAMRDLKKAIDNEII